MAKNIVIFSDGTGQVGGITFDEIRTNVYKLYRACRVGPDTSINPNEQVAFYDPGLGSASHGGHLRTHAGQWIYNWISKATGLGITRNIVDCYAALIRLYRDGDRVFLIGFSRGAYTVRSLAGVLTYCGIPRQLPNSEPLPLDVAGSTALAERAVKDVYQFCSSYDRNAIGAYRTFMMNAREAIALKFREEHESSVVENGIEKANVAPHFVGVFDTVAALGHKGLAALVIALVLTAPFLLSVVVSFMSNFPDFPLFGRFFQLLTYWNVLGVIGPGFIATALFLYLKNYLKWAPAFAKFGILKSIAAIHFAQPKHKFYDTTLNVNVGYAKHAISIDEDRADFKRVGWQPDGKKTGRDKHDNLFFEQVWFSGVHADIGGGYVENESRLSDITLKWMLAAAAIIPDGIRYDRTVLKMWSASSGSQHDEQHGSIMPRGLRNLPLVEATKTSKAIMHKTVYERFVAGPVVLFDKLGIYRPKNLFCHVDFAQYFDGRPDPQPAPKPQCVADDVERKWQEQTEVYL